VHNVTGVPPEQLLKVTEAFARTAPAPSFGAWGRLSTPSATPWCAPPCILQLALGNIGVSAAGANIFAGHEQRAGRDRRRPQSDTLLGLLPGRGARILDALGASLERGSQMAAGPLRPGDDGQARHDGSRAGDRRRDGEEREIDQDSNIRAMVYWGHAPNSQTRGLEMVKAMKMLE